MRKIGIYFSHYECFGHTTRVLAFAEVLRQAFPRAKLFFIQNGKPQPMADMGRVGKVYVLSQPLFNRSHFMKPAERDSGGPVRASECLAIIRAEQPDIFVTEYFPLGRSLATEELMPVLIELYRRHVPIYGIAGYPLLTGPTGVYREFFLRLYKKIFIFSPKVEKEYIAEFMPTGTARDDYLDFFRKYKKKVVFCGYLVPKNPVLKRKAGAAGFRYQKKIHIAVVRGGGAYAPQIIISAIKASDLLGTGYEFIIITGPSTTQGEWQMFQRYLSRKRINNVRLVKQTDRYDQLLAESDVCVCPVPYHTALRVLQYARRAVILPFTGESEEVSFCEQPARARLLEDYLRSEVLSFKGTSPALLAETIERMSEKDMSGVKVPQSWFTGNNKAISIILRQEGSRVL